MYLVECGEDRLALKQLRMRSDHDVLSSKEILDNFKQEFSTLKKLNHPNILRIVDFGFEPKEKFYYFTTEYIEGKDIFEATRGLTPEEIEELFVQALRALGYLHSQGVFHFDIKPTNILVGLDENGNRTVKLIDFGLTAFQKKGILAGSPAFMAPEALLEEARDGRSDLYSLGVTWYTCLAGTNPFKTSDMQKTIDLQRVWSPPRISTQSAKIPPYLDPILEKLLRKNPTVRYHRADQVIRDLNWSGRHSYPLETEATALAYLPGEGRLVGRDAEWGQLVSIFNRIFVTRSESKGCVVISGEPGSGKSRLLNELKYHAQLQTITVLNLMETTLGKLSSNSLLIAEDIDTEVLKWVETWMHQFSTHSFLIVLTGKNLPDVPELGIKIQLKNFDRAKVAEYIASVLGMDHPPDFLAEELHRRSEGNPLFLTQLLYSLIQSHQIFDNQGRWSSTILKEVGIDFSKLEIPQTLSEFCQAKYSLLNPKFQKILSFIALTKGSLTTAHFQHLGLEMKPLDWKRLEKENLVSVDPVDGEIKLLNPSFADFIPKTISSKALSALHQSLGELFLHEPATQEPACYHLGLGLGSREQRFEHLKQHGESLLQRSAWLEALRSFTLAAEIAPNSEKKVEVILKKSRALFRIGNTAEALSLLTETKSILKQERENPLQWRWVQQTYREMANMFLKEGKLDLTRESLQASRVLLEEHEDNAVEEMILDNFKASLLMREGKIGDAEKISADTYRRWQALPTELKQQVLNNEIATIYLSQRKPELAQPLFQEQAGFFGQIRNLSKQAYALYGWAETFYALKNYDEAVQKYHACANLSREIKNEELLFHTFNGLGNIAYFQKDWERAANYYQEALELAQHNASLDSTVGIAINLAMVLRFQGDYGQSQMYLQHVIATLEAQFPPSLNQLYFLVQGYVELGRLKLAINHFIEARDAFRDAARMVRNHPPLARFRFLAGIGLAETSFHLERPSEAQTVLMELEKENLTPEEKKEFEDLMKKFSGSKSGDPFQTKVFRANRF